MFRFEVFTVDELYALYYLLEAKYGSIAYASRLFAEVLLELHRRHLLTVTRPSGNPT